MEVVFTVCIKLRVTWPSLINCKLVIFFLYFHRRGSLFPLPSSLFHPLSPLPVCFFLFFLPPIPGFSFLLFSLFKHKAFWTQLGRRTRVCGIKDSVETITGFGMWKWSKGTTVCICIAPERLPRNSNASGKGSQQSDCTPGHKTPTIHCFLLRTLLRHREKAIKAFIGFVLKICSQQLKIITNQIKIEVAQTTIRRGHRLDLCYCETAQKVW